MKKQTKISKSKLLFADFIQIYLHSLKAKLVFWIIVFGAAKTEKQIEYRSRSPLLNFIERLWIAHQPRLDEFYQNSKAIRAFSTLAVLFGLVVVMQFLYPSDRALPQARLEDGRAVGFMKNHQVRNKIDGLNSQVVSVQTPNSITTATYADMGLSVDADATFDNTKSYSFSERLIPFSVFFDKPAEVSRKLDEAKFANFTDRIITDAAEAPVNARVHINGTKIIVEPSKDGYKFSQESLKTQLLAADLFANQPILFKPDLVPPAISTLLATQQAEPIQRRIDTPLTILAGGQSMRVEPETVASWVKIDHRPDQGEVNITLDKTKISSELNPLKSTIDKDPVPIQVTLLNGSEAGRTSGELGSMLKVDKLVEDIADVSFAPPKNVWGHIESINPPETIERRYTRDSQGFQALLDYWSQTNPGTHGIAFKTVDGYITAAKNADQTFGINGLSNIFIAHQVYGRIAAGTLDKSGSTSLGSSVGSCIRNMMQYYDTSCMSVLGNIIGWGDGDQMLRQQGFSQTSLSGGAPRTSSRDTAEWLSSVLNRSLTTYDQTNELLAYMKNQTQRAGIPAGSFGMSVANQAGITSSGVVADYGVVFHPSRNYILSVYSTGATFTDISELAREINKILSE